MMQARREPAWKNLPMARVIEAVAASSRGFTHDEREHALHAFERAIGIRRHGFARERVGESRLVTLPSMQAGGAARRPLRRVTWSLGFTDQTVRDDLFACLAARIDRWDDWGEMAFRKGADSLTGHLLSLIVASRAPGAQS